MKDKELRKFLKFDGYYNSDVIDKINQRLNQLFLPNYFSGCPCCKEKEVLVFESVKFEKLEDSCGFSGYGKFIDTYHTSKESYEIHKSQIKKWEAEVKAFTKKK